MTSNDVCLNGLFRKYNVVILFTANNLLLKLIVLYNIEKSMTGNCSINFHFSCTLLTRHEKENTDNINFWFTATQDKLSNLYLMTLIYDLDFVFLECH